MIPVTDCVGFDRRVALVALDIDRAPGVIHSDPFCSWEEEVFGNGHEVFPKARVVRTECDTVPALQHDHVGCPAGCYWSWVRESHSE